MRILYDTLFSTRLMNEFTVIQCDLYTIYSIYLNRRDRSVRVAKSRARRRLCVAVCLTDSRKPTGAAETVYEFYKGLWTKVRSDPVWSRCSATPGPRQVYIVSRAAVRIPTCLLCVLYPLISRYEYERS